MMAAVPSFGQVLKDVGNTYDISERDALSELENRVGQVDWGKELSKIDPESYRPEGIPYLPVARTKNSYFVDPTYTLERDIPDQYGGILYPAGFKFNPLDFVSFQKTIIVIDGNSADQLAWFKKTLFYSKVDTTLLLSGGGSALDLAKKINRPVYYVTSAIAQKFRLAAVPAIVKTSGRLFSVETIPPVPMKEGIIK